MLGDDDMVILDLLVCVYGQRVEELCLPQYNLECGNGGLMGSR